MTEVHDQNAPIVEEFRSNAGEVGGRFAGAPMLLLTTVGAKTGLRRTSPLMYLRDGERLYVIASNAGQDDHPSWYRNVLANAEVDVEVGTERYAAEARPVAGAERDRVYARQAEAYPGFAEYERMTSRVIPVVMLDRR